MSMRKLQTESTVNIYQKYGSLREVSVHVVTDVLGNAPKLSIVVPLICMEISNYTQPFRSIVLFYLIQFMNQLYLDEIVN